MELELKGQVMKPMEVLLSATRVNAEIFRMEDQIGSVEPGKYADLIAVKGNPLKDLRIFQNLDNLHLISEGRTRAQADGVTAARPAPRHRDLGVELHHGQGGPPRDHPLTLTWLRFLLAALFYVPFALATWKSAPGYSRREWVLLVGAGIGAGSRVQPHPLLGPHLHLGGQYRPRCA